MTLKLALIAFFISASAYAQDVGNSRVVTWLTENAVGYKTLSDEQKAPIERVFGIFLNRLENWKTYSKFYDALYLDESFKKDFPYFVDPSKGPFVVFLEDGQKLTDLEPYKQLKGKTVEEVFGYKGDLRIMDDIGGEATRLTLIMPKRELTSQLTGTFTTVYHEFGHILQLSLMLPWEFRVVAQLYQEAKDRNGFIEEYSAHNSAEYFAQGLEAYLSETKDSYLQGTVRGTSREQLKAADPKLYEFVERLVEGG